MNQTGVRLLVSAGGVPRRQAAEPRQLLARLKTPLKVLLCVAFSRWHVERCFEAELGFDHFEGRSYVGLIRHQTITALTHLFLSRVHQEWRGDRELTVCQVRTAAAALVQSWWLTGKEVTSILQRAANIITDTQDRKARSRKSHRKRTLRRLNSLDIHIHRLPKCGWDDD